VNVHIRALDSISILYGMLCRKYGKRFGSGCYLSPQNITFMGQNIIIYPVTPESVTVLPCSHGAMTSTRNNIHHAVYGVEQLNSPIALD
jgi:hypothetical protein